MAASSSSSQPQGQGVTITATGTDYDDHRKLMKIKSIRDEDNNERLSDYLSLYEAALRGGDNKIFQYVPNGFTVRMTENQETALHVAVGTGKWNHSVDSMVDLMEMSELEQQNRDGDTALSIAAMVGNIEAAKMLVKKAPHLITIENNVGRVPLIEAARHGQKNMVLYLLEIGGHSVPMTRLDADKSGVFFLDLLIIAGYHDIVLDLIRRNQSLAKVQFFGGESVLSVIAGKPSSFPSGTRLKFWERTIYFCESYIPVKLDNKPENRDVENPSDRSPSIMCNMHHFTRIFWVIRRLLTSHMTDIIQLLLPALKRIRDTKLMHRQTLELVKLICKALTAHDYPLVSSLHKHAILSAAKSGINEVVEEIVESFPHAIWYADENNHNIFHLAVIHRREKVFNLIYQMTDYKHLVTVPQDTTGNNILHLAGMLAPAHQLNLKSGAALQMQRELHWFKEVEKFVQPSYKEDQNSEGKTPAMVFTEEHKYLVKMGENWMKATANSCIFVAALMATVGFAAAITVPGGNNQDNGIPIFSKEKAFVTFGFADALSLFSSTTSMLMFLSILTARYAEADFLYSLPKRLIIGLLTLFLSIMFMMIAFGASLYLVFGNRQKWFLTSIATLACVPVALFGSMQFSLLGEMIKSTYGRSIFRKQSSRILY